MQHEISLICGKEVTAWPEKRNFHKTRTKRRVQWQTRRDPVPSIVTLAMKATSAEQIAS